MASPDPRRETALFQAILPQLEADGFEVFLYPSAKLLPTFLQTYRPDAIALKGNRKIAIEVTATGTRTEVKLERLRKIFAEHDDWELRVIYAPPRLSDENLSVPSRASIKEQLDRVTATFEAGGPMAGLLTGWATFEAAARYRLPTDLGRAQDPASLLEVLATDGHLTPDEADSLRDLARRRHQAAHGSLDVPLSREELDTLIEATRTLLDTDH